MNKVEHQKAVSMIASAMSEDELRECVDFFCNMATGLGVLLKVYMEAAKLPTPKATSERVKNAAIDFAFHTNSLVLEKRYKGDKLKLIISMCVYGDNGYGEREIPVGALLEAIKEVQEKIAENERDIESEDNSFPH